MSPLAGLCYFTGDDLQRFRAYGATVCKSSAVTKTMANFVASFILSEIKNLQSIYLLGVCFQNGKESNATRINNAPTVNSPEQKSGMPTVLGSSSIDLSPASARQVRARNRRASAPISNAMEETTRRLPTHGHRWNLSKLTAQIAQIAQTTNASTSWKVCEEINANTVKHAAPIAEMRFKMKMNFRMADA
jgi:hypothetical protein